MENNERGGNDHSTEGRREYGSNESRPYRSRSENGGRRRIVTRKREDRPYITSSDSRETFADRGERRPYGERKSYGDERRNYGDRRPSAGGGRAYGEHRQPRREDGERPYGERRSYGDRKPSFNGDRKPGFKKAAKPGFEKGRKRPAPKPMFRSEDESGIGQMINRRKEFEQERLSDNDNVAIPFKEECRLNKYIANSGICSRREADNFILAGCVTVNGSVVTELGTKINVTKDDVRFNGERLHGEEKVYIVMNKPKGFVTTTSDPHAEKTVMELLKKCTARVFPVGRLDKNTTGVLMFTNDGEIAERLTHPAYDKKKIYQVSLDKDLTQEDYDKILSGVTLSDGEVAADALDYIEENDHRKMGIEIHSGKNRIVRRIFESLGYDVKALDRVYFAGLTKKNLKRGDWRYLTEGEVNILKMGAYI